MEGFPRTADEAKYLGDSGLFPDGVVTLSVSENDIYDRLMPPVYEKWKTRRDKKMEMRLNKHIAKMKAKVLNDFYLIAFSRVSSWLCCP